VKQPWERGQTWQSAKRRKKAAKSPAGGGGIVLVEGVKFITSFPGRKEEGQLGKTREERHVRKACWKEGERHLLRKGTKTERLRGCGKALGTGNLETHRLERRRGGGRLRLGVAGGVV